ncbi:MAG: winged helix-turn-helix domain-containing protein [Clostridia bacterium]|nr:winged helix-turn-helix domain-containing protein [Clostridia bacterium]
MNICIITRDKIFARMLFLELQPISSNIKCINEKLNINALKLAVEKFDYIIYDDEYYGKKHDFPKQCEAPMAVITRAPLQESDFAENVAAVFERPFDAEILVAHVREQGEKTNTLALKKTYDSVINMELDQFSKQARINGEVYKFSPKEFSLLSLLYRNRGRVVERNTVLETVWGKDYDPSNNVDNVYVNYLRKKLDEKIGIKLIYTVRGKGYMMK